MKKILISLFLGFMIIGVSSLCYATSAELKVKIENNTALTGDTVTITARIENIEGVERGFNALTGKIEYNENVFETVQSTDFKMADGWDEIIYNPNNKMFVTARGQGLTTGADIFQLVLKVKQSAQTGSSIIILKEFNISEGNGDVQLSTAQANIIIKQEINQEKPEELKSQQKKEESSNQKLKSAAKNTSQNNIASSKTNLTSENNNQSEDKNEVLESEVNNIEDKKDNIQENMSKNTEVEKENKKEKVNPIVWGAITGVIVIIGISIFVFYNNRAKGN